jgi:Secretion system C-terminal sorting domain
MAQNCTFQDNGMMKLLFPIALLLVLASPFSGTLIAQTNVGLTAVASQTAGSGVTIYGPTNYNDNSIVGFTGCSGYGTCPTPWGWVANGGTITYTWTGPVTFSKIVFYHADRPMNSCSVEYWNGTGWTVIAPYTTAICQADSMSFPPVTTTILQFVNCVAPLINPNFREIQVWQTGPPPPTITGATHYCTGDIVTLTASSTFPSPTYAWSGPSAFSATTAAITFTASPATAGVYSCVVTTGGVPSSPALDTIVVTPRPTITLGTNPAVCRGTTSANLPYVSTTSSPTNYTITYSAAALAAGFTNVTAVPLPVSPIVLSVPAAAPAAAYTGTVTVNNGSCTGPGSAFTLTVNPNPAIISGVANTCTGSTITLTDATSGGYWLSTVPGVATIGSSTGLVTGITVGATTISYTLAATGCYTTALINVVGISGPDHVCAGDNITLTSTSGGGTWTSGDVAIATVDAAGVVTGTAMGVVPISYLLTSGCVATWTVSVNPHAPIEGRDSVCMGGTAWLTNIVGGGTWTSVYPAVATIHPDSGRITGIVAGITTISYVLPTGCFSTVSYSVIDYPPSITGTKTACPGTSSTLSDAVTGGKWYTTNAAVATVDVNTGVFTGVYADTVDITYIIEPGCAIYTRVTVNPLPAPITGTNWMCPNTVDTMHDISRGGAWTSVPTTVVAIDTAGTTWAVGSGVGTIFYTLPTGCKTSKTISVSPISIPPVNYNFLTGELYTDTGYVTYQWYDSLMGKVTGATSPSIAAVNTEYYYVVVTDKNGCKGVSPKYYFDVTRLGVKNISGAIVNIYPNPATDKLYVESATALRSVISSIEGKAILRSGLIKGKNEIDISSLSPGVYTITLYDETGARVAVQKLIKE